MVFILMVFECWFAECICAMMVGSLWSACIWFVYVAFTCAGVTNNWMIVAAACKYGIDVYWFVSLMVFILMVFECWFAECICAMMVDSLWSGCIWFVYVAFACAGATNDWMIVAAACKYGIDVYWFVSLMVFILMVFECWFCRVYMWHDGWFALVDMLKTTDIDT